MVALAVVETTYDAHVMGLLRVCRYAAASCLTVVAFTATSGAASALSPQLALSSTANSTPDASVDDGRWVWPLDPQPSVVRIFAPPAHDWEPGHRGVDLLGRVGQPVGSIGEGTVSFAGGIAGRGVVVVRHGSLRSTYEPVTATVRVGDRVAAGDTIGVLQLVQSHCLPTACLHLGLRQGDRYLDPMGLFGPRSVRLKPLAETLASVPSNAISTSSATSTLGGSNGGPTSAETDSTRAQVGPGRRWLGAGYGVAAVLSGALGWRCGGRLQARG